MSKKTEELFARFQAIYGGRWSACYATEQAIDLAIAEWAEVIERMSDEQLLLAIAWAKTDCPWPPSIAEFLHAGLEIDEEDIREKALRYVNSFDRYRMTHSQLDKAVRAWRGKAMRNLIDDRLQPAIAVEFEEPEKIGFDTWLTGASG